jgi:hypothetical protein
MALNDLEMRYKDFKNATPDQAIAWVAIYLLQRCKKNEKRLVALHYGFCRYCRKPEAYVDAPTEPCKDSACKERAQARAQAEKAKWQRQKSNMRPAKST